jgi:hypothetical protein
MKLVALGSIALVLGSITSLAQTSGRKAPVVVTVVPGSINCPIDVRAEKDLGPGQMENANGKHDPGPSQNLHLTLTNPTYSQIVGVHITAYGLNAKGQLTPANTDSKDSSAMQTSIDLKLKVDPKAIGSADIVLSGFTSVTLLKIDSIRYGGGATWQPSAKQTCHVVPDGAMLINGR